MTSDESKIACLSRMVSELGDLLESHKSELDTDWHGYAGEARAALRAALERSFAVQKVSGPEPEEVRLRQIANDFETACHALAEQIARVSPRKGDILFSDGRSYEIVWGAYVNVSAYPSIGAVREATLGHRIQARLALGPSFTDRDACLGREMPETLRQALIRGSKRLEAWRHGGPFPATVVELFKE